MKALHTVLFFLTHLLLLTTIFALNEAFQSLDSPLEDSNDADAGFVWPGAVRTISVEGDTSFCKNTCNVYLNYTTGDSIHATRHIEPQIVFTGLKPGQYTVSPICRPTAKLHCLIEPGRVEFEVDEEISDSILDDINLGTLHARVEEMASPDNLSHVLWLWITCNKVFILPSRRDMAFRCTIFNNRLNPNFHKHCVEVKGAIKLIVVDDYMALDCRNRVNLEPSSFMVSELVKSLLNKVLVKELAVFYIRDNYRGGLGQAIVSFENYSSVNNAKEGGNDGSVFMATIRALQQRIYGAMEAIESIQRYFARGNF